MIREGDFMQLKIKPVIVLFKAAQSLINNVKVSLKDSVLTVNEFVVMEALYTKGELVTQEVADKILIPNSSLTYVLDVLEKKKYIVRERDSKDRRRQILSLSKQGEEIFSEVYKDHYEYMNDIFDVLTQEEQDQLVTLLKKVGLRAEEKLDVKDL